MYTTLYLLLTTFSTWLLMLYKFQTAVPYVEQSVLVLAVILWYTIQSKLVLGDIKNYQIRYIV